MPTVIGFTPEWLQPPEPGHQLFTKTTEKAANGIATSRKMASHPGPLRTIARRSNTEVFIAVGKEIRWADLAYLKSAWEHKRQKKHGKGKRRESDEMQFDSASAQGYRTIKTPVADDIRQLIISPHENYMAILTTHTVHIAILPDSSQLTAADTGVMKLKTFTLGPTTHVTSRSAIISALWHPLGVNGTCIVTVTKDAVVRVWELAISNHATFDRPTLAIDLKKLADGTSLDQDFGASVSGTNKAFSPDSFEMEVVSACFAGRRNGGWSPMTLWVAMREGDVYALCPLLPEKWSSPPTLIPSLSVSIVSKVALIEDDPTISPQSQILAQQQLSWMSDLDNQEPVQVESPSGDLMDIYTRPSKPGRVPRLQGPFEFESAPNESEEEPEALLSDIYVIGGKLDADELMFGEEDDFDLGDVDQEGLSVNVVCVLTSSGRLSICLDLEGVEAQWLPDRKSKSRTLLDEIEIYSLLTFDVMDIAHKWEVWEGSWPLFSPDVHSRYKFFITNTSSITFIDLAPWVSTLEGEMNQPSAGWNFRVDLLAKGQKSTRTRVHAEEKMDQSAPLSASVLIRDPDLGYFLLSATPYRPLGITFDDPDPFNDFEPSQTRTASYDSEPLQPLLLCEPRPTFEPGHALAEETSFPQFIAKLERSKHKRLLNEEVRLSPATLQIMTEAHKVLAEDTLRVGNAAADVFRRCIKLQIEMKRHIQKARDVAERVDAVTGEDMDDGTSKSREESIRERVETATERQRELNDRLEKIRRKVTKGLSRELSDKERAWVNEVKVLENKVLGTGEEDKSQNSKAPWARYEEVQHLKEELIEQIQDLIQDGETNGSGLESSREIKVPAELRRKKMKQVMVSLDRETALVDAARGRLERLRLET